MERKKRFSFLKTVLDSIIDFDKYQDFALEGLKKSIGYLVKFMLIFILIVTIAFTYKFSETVNTVIPYVQNNIPNYDMKNSELIVDSEKPIELEFENEMMDKIIIDTNASSQEEINEFINKISAYQRGIVFLKDRMLVRTGGVTGVNTIIYKDKISSTNFSKKESIDYIQKNKYILIIGVAAIEYILEIFINTIAIATNALILAVLAYMTARIIGVKIRYRNLLGITIHALTLPLLLNLIYIIVNFITGFKLQYFDIMYISVAYIYIVTAIFLIRSDLIKRNEELIKIEEIQEKVRNDIEEKQENPDEKDKDKDKKEKNDKDDSKQKDDNLGNEAKGEA